MLFTPRAVMERFVSPLQGCAVLVWLIQGVARASLCPGLRDGWAFGPEEAARLIYGAHWGAERKYGGATLSW